MHWGKFRKLEILNSSGALVLFLHEQLATPNLLFSPFFVFALEGITNILPHRLIEAMNSIVIRF